MKERTTNEEIIKEAAQRHPGDILPPYDAMMDMSGFEALCAFSRVFGGTSIYVPSLRTMFGSCLEKDIVQHYNGTNIRELVHKYGFSERHVRSILKQAR
ncbi:MAG: hypothetical protein FWD03_01410 [Defluviitaleaceae bacterium]|nr:hypothetical protein [Defluviitaleaceae bacterium]